MKKIAVLVSNPCTNDARVIRIAEAEAKCGYKVKVFATSQDNALSNENKNNVEYFRKQWDLSKDCKRFIPRFIKNKKIKGFLVKRIAKFIKYYSFKNNFKNELLSYKPNIIHAHDLLTLPLGVEIKKLIGSKLIYDAHELEIYRNPPLKWYEKIWVNYIEKKYSKYSDAVITVNDSLKNILKKRLNLKKIYTIRNVPDISVFNGPTLKETLNFTNREKVLLYVGKVTYNRGLEWVVEYLDKMPLNIHFVCLGHKDKNFYQNLKKIIKSKNLEDRVHFIDPVPHNYVVEYIKDADVGICAINPITKSYYYSLPNKIFEMSMAGLPIIATDLPEIRKTLELFGNGYFFSHKNPEKIVNLVVKALNDKIDREKISKIAREHSWKNESIKIKKVLDEL